jgi:hypothetical protein
MDQMLHLTTALRSFVTIYSLTRWQVSLSIRRQNSVVAFRPGYAAPERMICGRWIAPVSLGDPGVELNR